MCAPAEVAQLYVPSTAVDDQNVLGLDVPVDDVPLLQKPECSN